MFKVLIEITWQKGDRLEHIFSIDGGQRGTDKSSVTSFTKVCDDVLEIAYILMQKISRYHDKVLVVKRWKEGNTLDW